MLAIKIGLNDVTSVVVGGDDASNFSPSTTSSHAVYESAGKYELVPPCAPHEKVSTVRVSGADGSTATNRTVDQPVGHATLVPVSPVSVTAAPSPYRSIVHDASM